MHKNQQIKPADQITEFKKPYNYAIDDLLTNPEYTADIHSELEVVFAISVLGCLALRSSKIYTELKVIQAVTGLYGSEGREAVLSTLRALHHHKVASPKILTQTPLTVDENLWVGSPRATSYFTTITKALAL